MKIRYPVVNPYHAMNMQNYHVRNPYAYRGSPATAAVRELGQTTRVVAGAGVAMVGIGAIGSLGLGVFGALHP